MITRRKSVRKYAFKLINISCIALFLITFIYYKITQFRNDLLKTQITKDVIKYLEFKEQKYENVLQPETLKSMITKYNDEEFIMNLDVYGLVRPNGAVIVIFVDKYKANLKFLIASLQRVLGIADALVIFSHSYFDENVNNLIQTIDFAGVLQIFYPFSMQMYPNTYPRYQSGGSSTDISLDFAKRINSTDGNLDDAGRDRNHILSQSKHFWWWTMNHVFEKLSYTKDHKGVFIFLEDDVFLMQDLLFTTFQLKDIRKFMVQCDFISLQSEVPDDVESKVNWAVVSTWNPKEHFGALAFDSRVWKIIAAHCDLFCDYNDYSWSRSLFHVSLNRIESRFKVISSVLPRVYKLSAIETSNTILEYGLYNMVSKILDMQWQLQNKLYPNQLKVFVDIEIDYNVTNLDYTRNVFKSDSRDKEMCINMTQNKMDKLKQTTNYNEYVSYNSYGESEVMNYSNE